MITTEYDHSVPGVLKNAIDSVWVSFAFRNKPIVAVGYSGGIAGGNRNRDIAELLFISEETVKVHIKHIMEKLGAKDRTQAVAIAVRRGIIQL